MAKEKLKRALHWFDSHVLNGIEFVSQQVELLTGYDCFQQRNLCYVLLSGLCLFDVVGITGIHGWLWALVIFLAVAVALASMSWLSLVWIQSHTDQLIRRIAAKGVQNPKRHMSDLVFMRTFIFVAFGSQLIVWPGWRGLFATLIVLAHYLDACTPRPPAPNLQTQRGEA